MVGEYITACRNCGALRTISSTIIRSPFRHFLQHNLGLFTNSCSKCNKALQRDSVRHRPPRFRSCATQCYMDDDSPSLALGSYLAPSRDDMRAVHYPRICRSGGRPSYVEATWIIGRDGSVPRTDLVKFQMLLVPFIHYVMARSVPKWLKETCACERWFCKRVDKVEERKVDEAAYVLQRSCCCRLFLPSCCFGP